MRAWSINDCDTALSKTAGNVLVLKDKWMRGETYGQLFFCTRELNDDIEGISLHSADYFRIPKADVLGALKMELLPEHANSVLIDHLRFTTACQERNYCYFDCITEKNISPENHIVVLDNHELAQQGRSQLAYCTAYADNLLTLLPLQGGEATELPLSEVIGVVNPERLSYAARRLFSQFSRPSKTGNEHVQFWGLCVIDDGMPNPEAVAFYDALEATEYIRLQAPYQEEIQIRDKDGYQVFGMKHGEIVWPDSCQSIDDIPNAIDPLEHGPTELGR